VVYSVVVGQSYSFSVLAAASYSEVRIELQMDNDVTFAVLNLRAAKVAQICCLPAALRFISAADSHQTLFSLKTTWSKDLVVFHNMWTQSLDNLLDQAAT